MHTYNPGYGKSSRHYITLYLFSPFCTRRWCDSFIEQTTHNNDVCASTQCTVVGEKAG